MIRARGLSKSFGAFRGVDRVDFEVDGGEAFGFLGPNGAGKSSTMRMIACVSPRSGGELEVLGLDPERDGPRIRSRLGVVPQEDNLDPELSVRDNLYVYGRYFDLPRRELRQRIEELLDFAQLTDRADDRVEPLSGGMKRRLTIARSLVNETRAASPGRADDRARSAGPPCPVGSSVPAEGPRRHPCAHHSLHGGGGTALRPPRRDGLEGRSPPRALLAT